MSKQTVECPKCNGAGTIGAFYHVANGVCFCCGGAKTIEVDVDQLKKDLHPDAVKKAEWVLRATEASFAGWTFSRLNTVRTFCHGGFGLQEAYPGLLAHWREVGEPTFQAVQDVKWHADHAVRMAAWR